MSNEQKPYVGMPATYRIGSDKYAGRITEVSGAGHKVTWTRTNDAGELVPNFRNVMTRRRNGAYLAIGSNYGDLVLGVATTDIDQGF